MWVFLSNAFVSIVADRDDPELLLCRARVAGDLKRAFGPYTTNLPKEERTPAADYAYRMRLPRDVVGAVLASHAAGIGYDNFKKSISAKDHARHDACMKVWSVMHGLQVQDKPVRRKRVARTRIEQVPISVGDPDFDAWAAGVMP